MNAQGGYFTRLENFDGVDLVALAHQALAEDGAEDAFGSLRITVNARRKLVRLAFEGPGAQGLDGARWYLQHHAFARLLSSRIRNVVHAYVHDPDELELVVAYGNGRQVGGERLVYADVELPDDFDELDDVAFERLRSRWPLGHLAYVIGIRRDELLSMPRAPGRVISLAERGEHRLDELLPHAHVRAAV